MWARNLLFVVLCVAGVVMVASSLLDRNRIDTPRTFTGGQAKLVSTSLAADASQPSEKWPQTTARIDRTVIAPLSRTCPHDHWRA